MKNLFFFFVIFPVLFFGCKTEVLNPNSSTQPSQVFAEKSITVESDDTANAFKPLSGYGWKFNGNESGYSRCFGVDYYYGYQVGKYYIQAVLNDTVIQATGEHLAAFLSLGFTQKFPTDGDVSYIKDLRSFAEKNETCLTLTIYHTSADKTIYKTEDFYSVTSKGKTAKVFFNFIGKNIKVSINDCVFRSRAYGRTCYSTYDCDSYIYVGDSLKFSGTLLCTNIERK